MPARSSMRSAAASDRHARSWRRRSPRSPAAISTASRSSTASARWTRSSAPTSSRPFGGVPVGVKELEPVTGWPQTEGSLVFRDRVATRTGTMVERLLGAGGAVPVGLTTASEFGGLNVSVTKLNGVTHNPWRHGRTVGGSSGGSAAAVVGGLVPLATGGDGGGSIRIPAGYTGLLGMKGTYGRIPRGPARVLPSGHRRARLPRPIGARRGALLRRVRGLRLARSVEPPGAAGLGSGPRHARTRGPAGRGRARARRRHARARGRGAPARVGGRADRGDREWSRSTSTSRSRTSRRSG